MLQIITWRSDSLKGYGEIDSKFRFVILSAKRAKQLLRGARPKVKSKSKNLIRVAQEEVRQGLIDYQIVDRNAVQETVVEDDIFIGEELGLDPTSLEANPAEDVKPKPDKD